MYQFVIILSVICETCKRASEGKAVLGFVHVISTLAGGFRRHVGRRRDRWARDRRADRDGNDDLRRNDRRGSFSSEPVRITLDDRYDERVD